MGWRGFAASALLIAAAVPLVSASLPGCDAALPLLSAPTRAAQDDAGLGIDAPDDAGAPPGLTFPPPQDGEQGAYYWGWLDPVLARDGADRDDWYAFDLSPDPKTLMLQLVSNYTTAAAMGAYGDFSATAYGPDRTVALSSATGSVTIADASGGRWLVHITTDLSLGTGACEQAGASGSATPSDAYRNHGLYVGCRPVCATH